MGFDDHGQSYYTTITLDDGADTVYFDGTKNDDWAGNITFTPGPPRMVTLSKLNQSGDTHVKLGGRGSRQATFTFVLDHWTSITDNAQSAIDKLRYWYENLTQLTFKSDYFHPNDANHDHDDQLTCVIIAFEPREERGSQPHRYVGSITVEEDV